MKRIKTVLTILLICSLLSSGAMAVPATPTDRLAFRTGPNTRYAELFTLPQSTDITAISLEDGNGVTWVLVEFTYDGHVQRAYTGLKRMQIQGDIEYSSFKYAAAFMNEAASVYAAPYLNAAQRGKAGQYEIVSVLDVEGDYIYIEYYDADNKAPSRGYVAADAALLTGCAAGYMRNESRVYASPSTSSDEVGRVGKYEMVGCISTGDGFANIQFYSASAKDVLTGYVPEDYFSLGWE